MTPPRTVSEWQAIDTAPEDCYVLLHWPDMFQHPVVGIKYSECNLQGCWHADGRDYFSKPSHWMPLPMPPSPPAPEVKP